MIYTHIISSHPPQSCHQKILTPGIDQRNQGPSDSAATTQQSPVGSHLPASRHGAAKSILGALTKTTTDPGLKKHQYDHHGPVSLASLAIPTRNFQLPTACFFDGKDLAGW